MAYITEAMDDAAASADTSYGMAPGDTFPGRQTVEYRTAQGHTRQAVVPDIENLIGSDHDDVLAGDFRDNIIRGQAGDDLVYGGPGGGHNLGSSEQVHPGLVRARNTKMRFLYCSQIQ